jgi:hypothetical protein
VAGLVGLSLLTGVAFGESVRLLGSWLSSGRAAVASAVAACLIVAGMYHGYREGRAIPGGRRQNALPSSYPSMAAPSVSPGLRQALAQSSGPILVLPAATVRAHATAMYASLFHGRPLLNGYASYWPAGFAERMKLVCRLPEPDALAILRQQTGLETIVVHLVGMAFLDSFRGIAPYGCNLPGKSPPPAAEVERYAARKRMAWMQRAQEPSDQLELVAQDGTTLVFRVLDPRAAAVSSGGGEPRVEERRQDTRVREIGEHVGGAGRM